MGACADGNGGAVGAGGAIAKPIDGAEAAANDGFSALLWCLNAVSISFKNEFPSGVCFEDSKGAAGAAGVDEEENGGGADNDGIGGAGTAKGALSV